MGLDRAHRNSGDQLLMIEITKLGEDEQMGSGTKAFRKSLHTIWRHRKRKNESFSHAICSTQVPSKTSIYWLQWDISVQKTMSVCNIQGNTASGLDRLSLKEDCLAQELNFSVIQLAKVLLPFQCHL